MGVAGLLPLLKNASQPGHISDFKGSTAAVDGYCWLHRGAFSCAEKLVLGEKTDMHIRFCMKMIKTLQANGVRPVVVFDGKSLPSKAETNKKRSESKKENRAKARMLFADGQASEAKKVMRRCVEITPELAHQFIEELRRKDVDYIVAPYEADAQLAFLNLNGFVDFVVSEDSDLMLFGCERVFYKMDVNGYGTIVEKSKIPNCLGPRASTYFTHDKFRWACILSGCDYLESLPGIGLKKALKFLKPTSNTDPQTLLKKMPVYLNMPTLTVTQEYIDSFVKADNTFLYQVVFCPDTKKLCPLNPYPAGVCGDDMPYAGTYYDSKLVIDIALGNIHATRHYPMGHPYVPKNGIIVRKTKPTISCLKVSGFSFTKAKIEPKQAAIEILDEEVVKKKETELVAEMINLYGKQIDDSDKVKDEDMLKPKAAAQGRSFQQELGGKGNERPLNVFKKIESTEQKEPTSKFDKIVSRFFVSNIAPHSQVVAVKRKAAPCESQESAAVAKRQITLKDLFK
ncbi:exonuclease 1-like [Tropilaelaps mercedesae]|uniref:Exonuclease 1 n=1 Tax=Tropilaelaps mercedesae TaxID=418985 RepID=A0A1V9Y2R5_9ACAR|nr:exonuclease 1-like [Tropilaelaps mercedesae]